MPKKRWAKIGIDTLRNLRGNALRVYTALKSYDFKVGGCYPTVAGIGLDLRMDPNNVRRAIVQLITRGAIRRSFGPTPKGQRWRYTFPPLPWARPSPDGISAQLTRQCDPSNLLVSLTGQITPPTDKRATDEKGTNQGSLKKETPLENRSHTTARDNFTEPEESKRAGEEPGHTSGLSSRRREPLRATFQGGCWQCRLPIYVGDPISEHIMDGKSLWVHADCWGQTAEFLESMRDLV